MKDLSEDWFVDGRPTCTADMVYQDILTVIAPLLVDGHDNQSCILLEMRPLAVAALQFPNGHGVAVRDFLLSVFPYLRVKAVNDVPLRASLDREEYGHQVKILNAAVNEAEAAIQKLKEAVHNFHGRYY